MNRINKFDEQEDDDEYIVRKERYYSPNNHSNITERIIRYFEDPKESKALAEVKRLSMRAKKSSKNIRHVALDEEEDPDLMEITEKNRLMFREPKNERAVRFGDSIINRNGDSKFERRKHQFQTQTYRPKKKNMNLYDEIKPKIKKNPNKENVNNNEDNDNQLKFNDEDLYEDRPEVKQDTSKEIKKVRKIKFKDEEKNDKPKMNIVKIKNTYNTLDNNQNNTHNQNNTRTRYHQSNLKKSKKMNTEPQFKRTKFSESIKPRNNYRLNRPKIYDIRASYNPGLTEEYKKKNNLTIENVHNKEKLVINEYPTKDKDKKNLKNYKTEYIWDKNINRIVEKRIYFDEDDKNVNNSINYSTKPGNILSNEDNTLYKDKDKEEKNEEKVEQPVEKEEKIKVNLKLKKNDNDNYKKNIEKDLNNIIDEKPKDSDEKPEVKKIEIRKRLGDSQLIYKKIEKKDDKNLNKSLNTNINSNENHSKELNRSHRYRRRIGNYNTENKEPEKPIKKEIIIEQKTIIKTIDDTPEDKKENQNYKENKPVKEEPKKPYSKAETAKPINKIYRKRHYYLNKQKEKGNEKKEPEKVVEKQPEKIIEKEPEKVVEKEPEKIIEKKPEKVIENEPEKIIENEQEKIIEKEPEKEIEKDIEKDIEKEPEKEIEKEEEKNIEKEDEKEPEKEEDKEIKQKEPEKVEKHERFSTEPDNYVPKYKKKPKFEVEEKPKVIYTKKIKLEEKKPVKDSGIVKEKKIEIYKENKKEKPYPKYRKKNIRLNLMSDNIDGDKDNKNTVKNNPYSNYMKATKRPIHKNIYKQARTDSELIDDLEKIENYNVTTYLKDDLQQIYDSINEEFSDFKNDIFYTNINSFEIKVGEFDKKKIIPYYKRSTKVDDLCKGRVTTDDIIKKYSNNAKRFEREKNYK